MASNPQYAATVKSGAVAISTANTNRDGTGTLGTVFTAGASGSRIDAITIKAIAATTAGMVRLYLHNGTTAFLIDEVRIGQITPGAMQQSAQENINAYTTPEKMPLILPTGWSLRASTEKAETFNVVAVGGDF